MPAERLQLVAIFAHARPLVLVCLMLLLAAMVSAFAVWVAQLVKGGRERVGPRTSVYLGGLLAAGPLLGLTAAAYGILDMFIGISNVRPEPNMTVLAPGLAEASLCILLGLVVATQASVFRLHLQLRSAA